MSEVGKEGGKMTPWMKKFKEKQTVDLLFKQQPVKKDVRGTIAETSKDVILGALLGNAIAVHFTGKYSFWAGLGVSAVAHYTGIDSLSSTGVAMMASGLGSVSGVNGIDNPAMDGFSMEAIKARNKVFVNEWKTRLAPGWPKFGKAGAGSSETKTVGNVHVLNYRQDVDGFSDLDRLESALAESANSYQADKTFMQGAFGDLDLDERIY